MDAGGSGDAVLKSPSEIPEWIAKLEVLKKIILAPTDITIMRGQYLPRRFMVLSPDLYDQIEQEVPKKESQG